MPAQSPPSHWSQAPHPTSGSRGSATSTRRAPAVQLDVDPEVYASEKATGSRNRAIAYMLQSFGVLDADPDEVLDVYFRQCSIKVTSTDLARMAATLARGGMNPTTGRRVIDSIVVQRTLSVMVTCGMYDAAGDWVSAVGMPAKSGVGGGIVAVLPGQLGIGVYSPLLDAKGNSVRGVRGVPQPVAAIRAAFPHRHKGIPFDHPVNL